MKSHYKDKQTTAIQNLYQYFFSDYDLMSSHTIKCESGKDINESECKTLAGEYLKANFGRWPSFFKSYATNLGCFLCWATCTQMMRAIATAADCNYEIGKELTETTECCPAAGVCKQVHRTFDPIWPTKLFFLSLRQTESGTFSLMRQQANQNTRTNKYH